jgi:hypothetical protein
MPSKVPETFKKMISYLVARKKDSGEGLHNEKQRPWLDFQELGSKADNFDIMGLRKNFDREDANTAFMQANEQKDSEDAALSIPKMAADFLAACERDFADMRKRSRIRMMVHAGVRDRVNGDETVGPMALNTLHFLSAIENPKKVGPKT